MSATFSFFSSSIGRKIIMAVTGALLLGFVVAHLLGNLQVFLGQDAFNSYAAFLKSMPAIVWGARILLLIVFVLHFSTAFSLWRSNSNARPKRYASMATVQANPASLYMLESGIVVLLFVIIHLAHFTLGVLQPEFYSLVDDKGRHDVYSMLVHGFLTPAYAIVYIVSMLLLGFHLSHGFGSMFQTLGVHHPRYKPLLRKTSIFLATAVTLGYISIPLSVLVGIIGLP